MAADVGHTEPSSMGEGTGSTPPAKASRPEELPWAEPPLAPYRPPPVEDDDILGGEDLQGMAPEIVVNLQEEVEDLNTDLLTMDRQSDSPHPLSPRAAAALDQDIAGGQPPDDAPFDVLRVVPSTQPVTPPLPTGQSARRLRSRFRRWVDKNPPLAQPATTAPAPPTPYSEA